MGSEEFCAGLLGEAMETRACEGGKGRDFFSQWSPCSTSCGTGTQTRTISNTCSTDGQVGYKNQVCTQQDFMVPGLPGLHVVQHVVVDSNHVVKTFIRW